MVVNNFQNFCIFNSFYCLIPLIMIHQHDLLPLCTQQISAGDHPFIPAVLVQNRKIPVALAGHNILDLINIIRVLKGNQILRAHKIADRHALIDQTGRRVGVIRRSKNRTPPLLRQLADGHGHCRALAHNDAICLHLNGTKL